jgi:hypothetical protein
MKKTKMSEKTICPNCSQFCKDENVCKNNQAYQAGYDEAVDMVLDVVGSMYNGYNQETLEELRQRIV